MAIEIQSRVAELEANMAQVVLGKPEVVRLCIVTLLAGEHLLIEDVPGVGKTLVAKALAKSVSGDFCRIQFTPDLLPSDITGSSLFHAATRRIRLQPRPDLRQYRSGRRNQPHHAAHPIRPARSDERSAGVGRRQNLSAAVAVHGDRDAKSV